MVMHSNKGSAIASDLDTGGVGPCTEVAEDVPPEEGMGINLAMGNQWFVGAWIIGRAL
jgi:hypothetical protein